MPTKGGHFYTDLRKVYETYHSMHITTVSHIAFCMEITCYTNSNSESKVLYHGYAKDVYYTDNFIYFHDKKQNKLIYIEHHA